MIQLNDLSIGFNKIPIIDGLNFTFEDDMIYGILAKSGRGKTTLLRTIAGILKPISGNVIIDGKVYPNAYQNPVYMMHQKYSNFDWLKCVDNVLIAQRDIDKRDEVAALEVLKAVGLLDYYDKYPTQLSGGMQQRLALARTLYVKPKYLLMDEPLSALDDKTRTSMQQLITAIQEETHCTIVMVTHSQDEASKMCDEIIKL